jgi:hypothetical protein
MRRPFLILILTLVGAIPSLGQTTTVSGQVTDTGGQTWNNGTYTFTTQALGQVPLTGTLDATGSYSQAIPHTAATALVSDRWTISVCPAFSYPCSTFGPTLIIGATQTLNFTPIDINFNVPTVPQTVAPISAYADDEITGGWVGFQYYNVTSSANRVCTTVSGGTCTVWAAAGGSGITSVAVLPALPCTEGTTVYLSVAPKGNYTCLGGVWVGPTSASASSIIDPLTFGAKNDVQIALGSGTATVLNNTSPNVTVPLTNFFCNGGSVPCVGTVAGLPQTSSVGKRVKATNGCCNSNPSPVGVSIVPAATTILSVTDANHAVMSNNATASCTTGCAFAIGTDSTAALASLTTAVKNGIGTCPTVVWPSGFIFGSKGFLNAPNSVCASGPVPGSDALGGATLIGQGNTSSGFIPLDFDYTVGASNSCGGGGAAGGTSTCIGSALQNVYNWELFGLFDSVNGGGAKNVVLFSPAGINGNSVIQNVNIFDWLGADNTSTGLSASLNGITFSGVNVLGAAGVNCKLGGASAVPVNFYGGSCGNSIGNSLQINGVLNTYGVAFGQTGATGASTIIAASSSVYWQDFASLVFGNPVGGGNGAIFLSGGGGTAVLDGTIANNGASAAMFGIFCDTATICRLKDTQASGGSANFAVSTGGTGKVIDECGNRWTSGGGGTFSGNLIGSCSADNTLFTAGAMVPSGNWGTGAAVSAPFGGTRDIGFTLTNGSASVGANPTLTYTFPTAFYLRPAGCIIQQVGGTQAQLTGEWTVGTPTTTSVVFTYNGTPTINLTEIITVGCH